MDDGAIFINYIILNAKKNDQRTGQFLFNALPDGAAKALRGTLLDPFHRDYSPYELTEWVQNHLVFGKPPFGEPGVIGVFNGNQLLWEYPTPDRITKAVS